jgi:hypothetical protein
MMPRRERNLKLVVPGLIPVVVGAALLAYVEARARGTPPTYSVNWRFYRAVPGFEDEFLRLFVQNRSAVLTAAVDRRRIRSVRFYKQDAASAGQTNWTAAVAVEYLTSAGAPQAPTDEDVRRAFPDRVRYEANTTRERRLVDAEWQYTVQEVAAR